MLQSKKIVETCVAREHSAKQCCGWGRDNVCPPVRLLRKGPCYKGSAYETQKDPMIGKPMSAVEYHWCLFICIAGAYPASDINKILMASKRERNIVPSKRKRNIEMWTDLEKAEADKVWIAKDSNG